MGRMGLPRGRTEQPAVWGSPKLAVGGLLDLWLGAAQSFQKAERVQACSDQSSGRTRSGQGLHRAVRKCW